MLHLRFYISLGIFLAMSVLMPFIMKVETSLYMIRVGVLVAGYLIPSGLTYKLELKKTIPVWIGGSIIALVLYDFLKTFVDEQHVFFADWLNFYSMGLVFFMGIHSYSRFISLFVFKQMVRPSLK